MDLIIKIGLKNIVASAIICVLALVTFLYLLNILNKEPFNKTGLKMFGSLLLVGVMLYADNVFVYLVSPLIIGTLVADPAFIERITALLSKNKEYFKPGTEADHAKKIEQEIASELPLMAADGIDIDLSKNLNPSQSIYKTKIDKELEFERKVINALSTETDFLPNQYLEYNVGIYNKDGSGVLFDGLISMPSGSFDIIEIRNISDLYHLSDAVDKIKEYAYKLKRFFKKSNTPFIKINCLLIVPDSKAFVEDIYDDVAVLKYNADYNAFTNKDKIYDILMNNI